MGAFGLGIGVVIVKGNIGGQFCLFAQRVFWLIFRWVFCIIEGEWLKFNFYIYGRTIKRA